MKENHSTIITLGNTNKSLIFKIDEYPVSVYNFPDCFL